MAVDDDGRPTTAQETPASKTPDAMIRRDRRRLLAALHGLAAPEHAAFVAKLACRR